MSYIAQSLRTGIQDVATRFAPGVLHVQVVQNPPDTPVLGLVNAIVNSVLEVLLLCFAGYILAAKGILDAPAKKTLNHLNTSFLTPALLFSKIAYTLTPGTLIDLAIVPVGWVFATGVGLVMAYVLGSLFRLKDIERKFAMAVAMSPNSNSYPIAIVQSLILQQVPLNWREGDNKDNMMGRALTYLMLYSTLSTIARWSIGVRLLSTVESMSTDPQLTLEDGVDAEAPEPVTFKEKLKHAWSRFYNFMTIPLWSSLFSIVVALIPKLQQLLEDMDPLKNTVKNAGNCAVPLNIIVLGAYFYNPPSEPPQLDDEENENARASAFSVASQKTKTCFSAVTEYFSAHHWEGVSLKTIFVASVSRMLLTPIIVIPVLYLYVSKFETVADDPVFVVCACLLAGGPAAITLAQVTSKSSGKLFEKLISQTLFLNYILLSTPVTIALVLLGLFVATDA